MKRPPSPFLALLAFAAVTACAKTPSAPASAQAPSPVAAPSPTAQVPATLPAAVANPAGAPARRTDAGSAVAVAANDASADADAASSPAVLPLAIVHKTPTCGCCRLWVDHLREAGFKVDVREHDDLQPVKARLGVPADKASCHTAEIGGFFVEGHVPAEDIKRLLADKPQARGLTVPGMPLGSPGMEMPDGRVEPYTVELVRRDGSTQAYASHGQ